MNLADIVVVAILAVFGIAGFSKGFFHTLLNIFSTLVALAIGIVTAKPVAAFLDGTFKITNYLSKIATDYLGDLNAWFQNTLSENGLTEYTGEAVKNALGTVDGVKDTYYETILKNFIGTNNFTADTVMGSWLGGVIGDVALLIISVFLVFIGIKITTAILGRIFDTITHNPAVGALDRLLGLAFGVVKGAIIVAIIFVVLNLITFVPFVGTELDVLINESTVALPIKNYIAELISDLTRQVDWNSIIPTIFDNAL